MIYFITTKEYNFTNENLTFVNPAKGKEILKDFYDNNKHIALDTETTGLDAYVNDIVLTGFGNVETQIIVDSRYVKLKDIIPTDYASKVYVGHNLKFDYSMILINDKIDLKFLWDTMIVEQRITQGYEVSTSLEETLLRRLEVTVDKSTTLDFTYKYFELQFKHLEYLKEDLVHLLPLKEKQTEWITKLRQENLFYKIEFPLIRYIAQAELEGFVLNKEAWIKNIKNNEIIKYEKELALDEEVRSLRVIKNFENDEIFKRLSGGKFDRNRSKAPDYSNVLDLFGEPMSSQTLTGLKKKIQVSVGLMNWSSPTQLIDLFARLEEPLPTKFGEYDIPIFDSIKGVLKHDIGFITQAESLEQYFIEKPLSVVNNLLKLLLEYREVETELSSFGVNFLDKVNPITGKIHTIYRQAKAVNGRLQSGGGKKESDKFNSQNIPRKKTIRQCFGTDEGYSISTVDLSGAEAITMASKAQDFKLKRLVEADIHSHLATIGFKNIYLYRAGLDLGLWDNNEEGVRHRPFQKVYNFFKRKNNSKILHLLEITTERKAKENYNLYKTFYVDKKHNAHFRQSCKNLTFGGIYGCKPKKAAKTIDVSREEGLVYLNTAKSEIPDVYNLVESNVKKALTDGFLVLNSRTNSRIWFPLVLDAKKNKYDIDDSVKYQVEGQARNIPISGTQADMIKEAMVEIGSFIEKNKLDCKILIQVHDELVVKHPLNMDGVSEEWKAKPHYVTFTYDNGKTKLVSFAEFTALTMEKVCNRYLVNMTMNTERNTLLTWTK
jgi:DNA polymerase I-like protein with 3'-5' exonuclease and polymerase domains